MKRKDRVCKNNKQTISAGKNTYQPTPFMTAESRVIDGKVEYVEIPINWALAAKGRDDGN